LVVFVDLGLNFADTGVIGDNDVADPLRIGGDDVVSAIDRRQRPHQKAASSNTPKLIARK
jgi:hypothetical protein